MESFRWRTLGQLGGALMMLSMPASYFTVGYLGSPMPAWRYWMIENNTRYLVVAFIFVALAQIRFGSREVSARIFLAVGGLLLAALVYKLWIAPTPSAVSKSLLGQNFKYRPSTGAYMAMIGGAIFVAAAYLEFRETGIGRNVVAGDRTRPSAPSPASVSPPQ